MEQLKEFEKLLKNGLKGMMTSAMPELKKVQETLAQFTTPQEQKNVEINGDKCVIMRFEDKVTIMFPSKEAPKKYYENFDVLNKEVAELKDRLMKAAATPWYKRLNRW